MAALDGKSTDFTEAEKNGSHSHNYSELWQTKKRTLSLYPPLVLVNQAPCSSLWDLCVFPPSQNSWATPCMRGIQNITHQEISAQQRDGSVGVPGSIPTTSPVLQIRLARARFSLNCMFVFMCWLLCLVSYNPVGADPKPCFLKKSNYFIPWVCSANKIDKQKLPSDLWGLRTKSYKLLQTVDTQVLVNLSQWMFFIRNASKWFIT